MGGEYSIATPGDYWGAADTVVAVARELAGFVWAIGREVQLSGWKGIKPQALNP